MPGTSRPARLVAYASVVALVVLALLVATADAAVPRASMADIEHQVMCVTCGIPLEEAVSPQADRERAGIQAMIDKGMTTAQIKQALVVALGPGVLALPPRSGFDLAVYVVPVVVIVLLLVILGVGLRRSRRRVASGPEGPGPPERELGPLDAARLEEDLARFDS